MVFTLAATAFATGETGEPQPEEPATPTTYSITINNSAGGHTYEAYQFFTGDLYEGVLSNIVWGSSISEAGKTAFGDAAVKADSLKTEVDAKAFAKAVAPYLTTAAGSANTVSNGTYVISGLAAGYYLVKDQDGSLTGDNDAYTEYIVKVVKDTTAMPKYSVPEVDKTVKDNDGSTDYKEAADYNMGDSVPFQLKATLASNVSAYTTYKVVFHDTMSKGLTYNNDAKVYIDGTVTNGFTVTATVNADGITTLTVSCDDVKALGAGDSSIITVEYTATLNQNAALGSDGNPNKVKLEYSNNPNKSETGNNETGETPEDVVIIFTYELDTTKVDGGDNTKKLQGAEFVLYRGAGDSKEYAKLDASSKVTGWTATQSEATVLKSDANGLFKVIGLDEGTYYLKETKAPDGYNLLKDDITVVITATIEGDPSTLTKLEVTADSNPGTGNTSTGIAAITIANNKGSTLPETGGIGTTIFYTVGGILVLVAVVLLVTKKRTNGTEV